MTGNSQADPFETCRRCGACCVSYRITLPRCDLDSEGGHVPAGLTEPYTRTTACMREQPDTPGRCIALEGTVGKQVRCTVYAHRPAACSEFAPLAALGIGDEACDEARRRQGLPPLCGL